MQEDEAVSFVFWLDRRGRKKKEKKIKKKKEKLGKNWEKGFIFLSEEKKKRRSWGRVWGGSPSWSRGELELGGDRQGWRSDR